MCGQSWSNLWHEKKRGKGGTGQGAGDRATEKNDEIKRLLGVGGDLVDR